MEQPRRLPDVGEYPDAETTQGPLYHVIIHNDDVTPMNFVMRILNSIFHLGAPRAAQIMYTAHFHGQAYVQTLPKAEAQKRVGLAHMSARLNRYPLLFTIEAEE